MAFAKDLRSVPNTHIKQLTTLYNFICRGSDSCGLHRPLHSPAHTYIQRHKQLHDLK